MQTYSHAIFNATIGKQIEKYGIRPRYWALVIGSLIPDVPLVILTVHYLWRNSYFGAEPDVMFGPEYDALYFTDFVWVTGHSLFHAPLMIALWVAIGWFFGFRRGQMWGKWVFWFAVGNGLHSAFDIVTHHNDGPLLLFPFNWSLRFSSPISYWDPQHHGVLVSSIEHALNLFFVGTWVYSWWQNRRAVPATPD